MLTLLSSQLKNVEFTGFFDYYIEGSKVFITAKVMEFGCSECTYTIGHYDFELKEGRILLAGMKEYKWYKNFKSMIKSIYRVNEYASVQSADSIIRKYKNSMATKETNNDIENKEEITATIEVENVEPTSNNEIKKESYTVANKTFNNYDDAVQYCLESDFDPELMIEVENASILSKDDELKYHHEVEKIEREKGLIYYEINQLLFDLYKNEKIKNVFTSQEIEYIKSNDNSMYERIDGNVKYKNMIVSYMLNDRDLTQLEKLYKQETALLELREKYLRKYGVIERKKEKVITYKYKDKKDFVYNYIGLSKEKYNNDNIINMICGNKEGFEKIKKNYDMAVEKGVFDKNNQDHMDYKILVDKLEPVYKNHDSIGVFLWSDDNIEKIEYV